MTISIFGFVFVVVFGYLAGLLTGYFLVKTWYQKAVDIMATKNQQLIERVKKAESTILHDLLQLSPDDIDLLKKESMTVPTTEK